MVRFNGTEKFEIKRKGRGPSKFCYTMRTVSELSGRSIWTVRRDVREGVLDMTSVMAVAEYVRLHSNGKATTKALADANARVKG